MTSYTPGQLDFPSDHFPIVVRLGDENGIGIASFNALNESYKHYIHGNQGLKDSKLDKMTENERYDLIVDIVNEAFSNGVGIFALQEVSNHLLARFYTIKTGIIISTPNMDGKGIDNGCVLLNPNMVQLKGDIVTSAYSDGNKLDNYIQQIPLCLSSDPTIVFTLINTHVKFGKIKQLISVLKQIKGPIIATGDFNVGFNDPREESSVKPLLEEKEFELLTNHAQYSHVNTLKVLDLFDHFYTRDITLVADVKLLALLRKDLKMGPSCAP
jgi:hypothetical protein